MPSLLATADARRKGVPTLVRAGRGYLAGAERNGSLVDLIDFGRLMRDIGAGVLCGVGIGVFVAMIGDLC
jgi:hypothetical protein